MLFGKTTTVVWVDEAGRILKVLNSTHEPPETLINKYIQELFMDNFADRFQRACRAVMEQGTARHFTCIVNFRGELEARRCRIQKTHDGQLVIVNYKVETFH